jgi:hypothetical protein
MPSKEPKYRYRALQPAANAYHNLEAWEQSRRSRVAALASGSPSMAQRQSGPRPRDSLYHHQPPPKAANTNPSIEIEPSMSASFTNMDCESQNRDNGNSAQFNASEKALTSLNLVGQTDALAVQDIRC